MARPKNCKLCNARFEPRTTAVYCDRCKPISATARMRAYRKNKPGAYRDWYRKTHTPKPPRVLTCPDCSEKFTARGRQLRCKLCLKKLHLARSRDWKRRNKVKIRNYDRRWHKENPEIRLEMQQRNRYAKNWRLALKRDGNKCTVCGSASRLVVHHRDGRGQANPNPNHALSNLQTMCRRCHAAHHKAEAKRAN